MALTEKQSPLQNLAQFQTWLVDTAPNSTYFQLSQFPTILNAGKNAFLIYGSSQLVNSTEVLIEIIDANGNPIFVQPIPNYVEGNARIVEIDIYEDTPEGLATITILGRLAQDVNGNIPPSQFQSAYNVKWQQTIPIAPRNGNTTAVRLYNNPTASVSEILNPFRFSVVPIITTTGSISGTTLNGSSKFNSINPGNLFPNSYIVSSSNPFFSSSMNGGQLITTVNSAPFLSNIEQVINLTTAIITPGYQTGSIFGKFVTTDFTCSYTGSPQYTITQYTQSFADIIVNNLSTFTGNIYRTKVFCASIDSPGDSELISDVVIQSGEMMSTSSLSLGQPKIRTGLFTHQSVITNDWTGSFILDSFMGKISLGRDSNVLIDAMIPTSSLNTLIFSESDIVPIAIYGPNASFPFNQNVEYTLSFNTTVTKFDTTFSGSMEMYMSGSAFPSQNPLGQLVGRYDSNQGQNYQPFGYKDWNFIAPSTGTGHLNFVIYGGLWYLADVSLKPATEFGFTPDEIEVIIPIKGRKFETLIFNIELYDINNNLVPLTTQTQPVLFDGGSTIIKGPGSRVDGSITVAPSGSGGATITTAGYTDITGVFQTGSTAIYIGAGQHGNANTPFLAASGSTGPVFSLGDRLIAMESGSEFQVTISGTLLVETVPGIFTDVRALIAASTTGSSEAFAIEAAGNALLSSSLNLAFSSSLLTASISSESSSMAQYVSLTSASLAAQAISFSSSQQQYIVSSSIVNAVNKIQLPTSTKTQDGLYLEQNSLGFYSAEIAAYSVVVNQNGSFLFGDTGSFSGGVYGNMVGFANGAFLVSSKKLLLQTPSLQLLGTDTSSAAANVLKLGSNAANITFNSGSGFYADGAGNFRVGSDTTGSQYLEFSPGAGLLGQFQRLNLNAGGLYLSGDSNNSPGAQTFKLGTNASGITLVSGSGFYADGAGNFRIGNSTGSGDYLLFSANNALFISSSNFFLNAGTSGSALQLNQFNIVIGNETNPGVWPFPNNGSTFKGFYANNIGQIFIGDATNNYVEFGGQSVNIVSSVFFLSAPGLDINSNNSGSILLGSATSLTSGKGVYIDGTGVFRAGDPNGNFVEWDNTNLNISITETPAGSGSVAPIQTQIINYIAFSPAGFYISNL